MHHIDVGRLAFDPKADEHEIEAHEHSKTVIKIYHHAQDGDDPATLTWRAWCGKVHCGGTYVLEDDDTLSFARQTILEDAKTIVDQQIADYEKELQNP